MVAAPKGYSSPSSAGGTRLSGVYEREVEELRLPLDALRGDFEPDLEVFDFEVALAVFDLDLLLARPKPEVARLAEAFRAVGLDFLLFAELLILIVREVDRWEVFRPDEVDFLRPAAALVCCPEFLFEPFVSPEAAPIRAPDTAPVKAPVTARLKSAPVL